MMRAPDKLQEVIAPVVTSMGYEFVGIEYQNRPKNSLLRVFIDAEQGVTVDDCARVSRQLSAVLDVEDPITGNYMLEISSPGLDRLLFTLEQYQRFVGSKVQIKLGVPMNGRRKFRGRMQAVEGDEVVLVVDDQEFRLSFDNIEQARVIPEL
jgi:ribosome maturation factor RimP